MAGVRSETVRPVGQLHGGVDTVPEPSDSGIDTGGSTTRKDRKVREEKEEGEGEVSGNNMRIRQEAWGKAGKTREGKENKQMAEW